MSTFRLLSATEHGRIPAKRAGSLLCCIFILAITAIPCHNVAAAPPLQDGPFGWCVCSTPGIGDDYPMDGGQGGQTTVLKSNGADMSDIVLKAIKNYDMVILDGSEGEFVFSERIVLRGLSSKTIAGINGAVLRTDFHVTPEIKALLDGLHVQDMSANSADGGGGILSNGQSVAEEREYNIRKALIELYGNDKETYRLAGIFDLKGCSNIVIRNLELLGPGSLDVGGYDLITVGQSRNVWIDHCHVQDGLDGNIDIISGSSQITVSWCVFDYTDLSYNHSLSNLVTGTHGVDYDNLNITWAFCRWGSGCNSRLPWAQFGTNHIFCCHYACPGAQCISASNKASLIVENCYFDAGVKRVYKDVSDGSWALRWRGNIHFDGTAPGEHGEVSVPYTYTTINASSVPGVLAEYAGPTLEIPCEYTAALTPATIGAPDSNGNASPGAAAPHYYNLMGLPLSRPIPGTPCIICGGTSAAKTIKHTFPGEYPYTESGDSH